MAGIKAAEDIYDLFNFPFSMIAQEEWNEL
jgi:hypothetical protein